MKTKIQAVLAGLFALALIAGCTGERGSSRNPASTGESGTGASAVGTPSQSGSSGSGGGM